MTPFTSINPATGREATSFEEHTPAQVESILADMRNAQRCWRNFRLDERADCLRRVAEKLTERAQDYARLITAEMGKPIGESLAEITRCAGVLRFYADHGPAMLAPETPEGAPQGARIVHEPLGIVLAVMPWNFPFWQVLRAAAPALLAGNAFLCKHAPSVTGCSLALEEALSGVGMSDGLYRALVVRDERVAAVVEDPRVRAVSLTGSRRAGSAVAEAAGRAVKKCVLELGGSDPFIVLADADLELAVHTAVGARFYNAGQTCISAKRFLVDRKVVREFEERLTRSVGLLKMGDPLRPETRIGPMARADLRDALDRQVQGSLALGARMILEGGPVPGEGFFYRPVVLAGVRPGMPVFEEEVFGPVASVTSVDGPGEALRLANQTRYGLGASVWTRDLALGAKLAGNIEAGNVAVNTLLKSDPRLPFGGVKDSGYGRELGRAGLLEFVYAKVLRLPPGA